MPGLEQLLNIPKSKITIDTLHVLTIIEKFHHNKGIDGILEAHWNNKQVISSTHFESIINILWNIKKSHQINHPFYGLLAKYLLEQNLMGTFWQKVDQVLSSSPKLKETISFAIVVLKNIEECPEVLLELLTENCVKFLNDSLKNPAQLKEDSKELFGEFLDLLIKIISLLPTDEEKFAAFKKLCTSPGSILIEKYLNKNIFGNLIANLGESELDKSVELLKSIIIEAEDTRERLHAANLIQKAFHNKAVTENVEWRFSHLKFFIAMGIFKSNDGSEIVKQEEEWDLKAKAVNANLKNSLYNLIDIKLTKIDDEKKLLLNIVEYIDKFLSKKNPNKYLAVPLKENHIAVWKKMLKELKNPVKNDRLALVFNILLLQMGLQLFNNPDVAENAINELESVLKRISSKSKKLNQEEPEWIEVVIDLFLNILSQNSNLLRNVIRHLFPQLCEEINLNAFHQILDVLNLNNKESPLSGMEDIQAEEESSDDEASENSDSDSDNSETVPETNGVDHDSEMEESSDDSDMGEPEEDEEDNEGNEKMAEKLRVAVQAALEMDQGRDEIDVDEIDEEEGAKLNEALSNAFKLLKKPNKKKQTKADKLADEALLHFRMRVLDLVDIYLKQNPQMIFCIEIMMFIFDLLPVAHKETKHQQILNRFNKIFEKLVQKKSFTKESAKDVTQKNLSEILTNLLDKFGKDHMFPNRVFYLNRACLFLIGCSQSIEKLNLGNSTEVFDIIKQNLMEFLQSRNPTLQLNTYQMIFGINWNRNIDLAKILTENGLQSKTRSLRRCQSLILLKIFLKNFRQFNLNANIKFVQKSVLHHIKSAGEISLNEFNEIIEILPVLHQFDKENSIVWKELATPIQNLRKKFILKSNIYEQYRKVCQLAGTDPVKNDSVEKTAEKATANDSQPEKTEENGNSSKNAGKKRKNKQSNKEKKSKKLKRLEKSSEGFSESFHFTNFNGEVVAV